MPKKKIAIVGATGYTGSELVRILVNHPDVEIAMITSESRAGEKFSDVHPFFRGICEQTLHPAADIDQIDIDLAFLALPHGVSMDYVQQWANKPFKMVDLSGDFRLDSPETYEAWYPKKHVYPEGFSHAAYGLPELFADEVSNASLVANPGCFPTGAILALTPLLRENYIEPESIIVDAKTGVTGAGVKPSAVTHFSNVNDNFKAYGLKKHRHTIEIEKTIFKGVERPVTVQFTPHLLPIDRGILSTIYAKPALGFDPQSIYTVWQEAYAQKPFIRLCEKAPAVKEVRGTNYCDLFATYDERTNNIIIITAIDNLVKGAAGAAVQNMNLMLKLPEDTGLKSVPLHP